MRMKAEFLKNQKVRKKKNATVTDKKIIVFSKTIKNGMSIMGKN